MLHTIEATIDQKGNVKLREAVSLPGNKRALVTILEDERSVNELKNETALLAEAALDKDAPKKHRNGRKGRK